MIDERYNVQANVLGFNEKANKYNTISCIYIFIHHTMFSESKRREYDSE